MVGPIACPPPSSIFLCPHPVFQCSLQENYGAVSSRPNPNKMHNWNDKATDNFFTKQPIHQFLTEDTCLEFEINHTTLYFTPLCSKNLPTGKCSRQPHRIQSTAPKRPRNNPHDYLENSIPHIIRIFHTIQYNTRRIEERGFGFRLIDHMWFESWII